MGQDASYTKTQGFLAIGMVLLLAGIFAFAYTGNYLFLFTPLSLFYFVLKAINWKTAYWVMLFCIPLSVEVNLAGNSLSVSLPDEPMMWLFFLLALVLVAENPLRVPRWFIYHPITVVVLLQFVWLIVAVVFSKVFLLSVKFLIAKAWMLGCFVLLPIWIFKEKKDFKTAFLLLLVPVLATVLVIMKRHAAVDYQFSLINDAISFWYYNHVEYSTVISMIFPLLCVAYPLTRGKSKWLRALLLGCIVLFLPAIFLTYARAAMLAIVFAIVVAVFIRFRIVNIIMPCFYGCIALLVGYLIKDNKYIDFRPDYEHTYMHHGFADHIIATFKGQDMSSMERIHRWVAAVRMSTDEPLTGYGPHGFVQHYKPYTVLSFRTYVSRNTEQSTTHNYFLYMLAEQGWPAMILYAVLVMVAFASAQATYHRFKDGFYKNCTLGLVMMFAACFVNNFFSDLIETHKVGALFYLSLSLLVILDYKSRNAKEQQTQASPSVGSA
jgi:O-antigen ligase